MLSFSRLVHAGWLVKSSSASCIMDPALAPLIGGRCVPEPRVKIDQRALAKRRFDALVISHSHGDHFCLDSLDLLSRDCLVVYPTGDSIIEACMRRMGFTRFRSLKAWGTLSIGDLSVTATPSLTEFPEMGILFRSGGRACWNPVDTLLEPRIIRRVLKMTGRLDLMFPYYQPMLEKEVFTNALGGDFPYARYEMMLRHLRLASPRVFVPGSCGFREQLGWLNDRQFPATESRFIEDAKALAPASKGIRLGPGDRISISGRVSVRRKSLDFIRLKDDHPFTHYDWRPDRGVPDLHDPGIVSLSEHSLKKSVDQYLNSNFLSGLEDLGPYLKQLKKHSILWRLEVVFPSGRRESRFLSFGKNTLRWQADVPEAFAQLHTSAAASVICALRQGRISVLSAQRYFRTSARAYDVSRHGLNRVGLAAPDPLAAVLFPGAQERYFLSRLTALGF